METRTIKISKIRIIPVPHLSESEVEQKYPDAVATLQMGDKVIQVAIPLN